MASDTHPNPLFLFAKMVLAPALFFLAFFFILTYPVLLKFKTHFYADQGDGLQNVWNLWWVEKAVTQFHQSPWHTTYLHFPYGTTLIGHTMNSFNGFVAIVLSQFLSQVPVHNVIVTFSFVAGGVTAFLLAHHFTHSYWPSIMAGYIFTFSNFHFAHAEGHLQIVSLEWIPLFVLLWLKLLAKPTIALGAAAAGVLFLVILCDYYYFFYCVLTGLIAALWFHRDKEAPFSFSNKEYWGPLGVFAGLSLMTSGILAGSLVWVTLTDGLVGNANPVDYSLDLLAPFIYGGHWRFAALTRAFWSRETGNIHENSVHLGLSVVFLLILVWRMRTFPDFSEVGIFFVLMFFFAVVALGPILHIAGRQILPWLPWPYAWMMTVFPPMKVASDPIRMMVMVFLCAAVISAFGFRFLFRGTRRQKVFASVLVAILFVEYLPKAVPTSLVPVPEYVQVLKNLPGSDGVLDLVANPALNRFYDAAPSLNLFYQTVHEKPLAFGYLARIPKSVEKKDRDLAEVIKNENFSRLWPDYHFRYIVSGDRPHVLRSLPGVEVVWTDGQISLFDISHSESHLAESRSITSGLDPNCQGDCAPPQSGIN